MELVREGSPRILERFASAEDIRTTPPGFKRRAVAIMHFFNMAAYEVAASACRNWRNWAEFNQATANGDECDSIWKKQKPVLGIIRCPDTRHLIDMILEDRPGKIMPQTRLGADVEDTERPGQVSQETKNYIALLHHLGVDMLPVSSHGRCGYINAVIDPANHAPVEDEAALDEETRCWRLMAKGKKNLMDYVDNKKNQDAVIRRLGFAPDPAERRNMAAEVEQGLRNAKLLKEYLAKEYPDSKMQVVLIHAEIRDKLNIYMYNFGLRRFFRITDNQHVGMALDRIVHMCGHGDGHSHEHKSVTSDNAPGADGVAARVSLLAQRVKRVVGLEK